MAILDTIGLESNKLFKINFNGGDLSSDGGTSYQGIRCEDRFHSSHK